MNIRELFNKDTIKSIKWATPPYISIDLQSSIYYIEMNWGVIYHLHIMNDLDKDSLEITYAIIDEESLNHIYHRHKVMVVDIDYIIEDVLGEDYSVETYLKNLWEKTNEHE